MLHQHGRRALSIVYSHRQTCCVNIETTYTQDFVARCARNRVVEEALTAERVYSERIGFAAKTAPSKSVIFVEIGLV